TSARAANEPRGSLLVGWAWSPTSYGGDSNGAHFWRASGDLFVSRTWSIQGHVMHGFYTDDPGVGRMYFTPVGLGPRAYIGSCSIRPFIDVLFAPTESHWGGGDWGAIMKPGFEASMGVRSYIGPRLALEAATTYVWSDDWKLHVFDA